MSSKSGWRGYIASREVGGSIIPHRVQNLVIRNYAQSRGMLFLLSATEYYMDNCYMMLGSVLEESPSLEGIIFYSTHQLPEDDLQRHDLYETLLKNKCELHFALEELSIRTFADTSVIEDVMMIRRLSAQSLDKVGVLGLER